MSGTTRMAIICGLVFIWSILVGVFLYYHKMTVDCRTNPAIKCWNDWQCLNVGGPVPSGLLLSNNEVTGASDIDEATLKAAGYLKPADGVTNMYTGKNGRLATTVTGTSTTPPSCAPLFGSKPIPNQITSTYQPSFYNGLTCCVFNADKTACVSGSDDKGKTCQPQSIC